jgi:eukaryotic-like serine/threonine-protein kinase
VQGDFHVGHQLIQPSLGRVIRNGIETRVRAKVMDLLVFLAEHPDEVLSKDRLLAGVWGTDALSESALTRSITELREALQDDAERPTVIETIPKRGYRLIAPVSPVPMPDPLAGCSVLPPAHDARLAAVPHLSAKPTWTPESVDLDRAQPGASVDHPMRTRLIWGLVGLAIGGAGATAMSLMLVRESPAAHQAPVARFLVSAPPGTTFAGFPDDPHPTLSRDGRHLVTVAIANNGARSLWVHAMESLAGRPLPGTEGAAFPFWSPDNQFIGFFADGKLKKVRVTGGTVEPLCTAKGIAGGTWSEQGTIVFALASGLHSVPSSGGDPVPLTALDVSRQETAHWYPHFLPGGRHYIYVVRSSRPEHEGIFLGTIGTGERKRLTTVVSNASYVDSGYLLFVRHSLLVAQPFSMHRLEVTEPAIPLAEGLFQGPFRRFAPFSASAGVLAYRAGSMQRTRLLRVDRNGNVLGVIGAPARYLTPAFSPDGKYLAIDVLDADAETTDIWVFDLVRETSSRFTFGPGFNGYPLWTLDGKSIVYASERDGAWSVRQRSLAEQPRLGPADDQVLLESRTPIYPQGWSPDGQSLVYVDRNESTGNDIWLLSLPEHRQTPLLQTAYDEVDAQISPDGQWMVYSSDESGQIEVYVRPFSSTGAKWRISKDGGCQPRWRRDGMELFYRNVQHILSAPIKGGPSLGPSVGSTLLQTPAGRTARLAWDYDVAPDGRQFLVKELVYDEGASPMVVTIGWQALLAR